jgi:hypothetical protein
LTWKSTNDVHFSAEIRKNGIESLNSCNVCKHENFKVKLSGIVGNSFPYKLGNFRRKMSMGCEDIAFYPVGYFFLSHPVYVYAKLVFWIHASTR